MAENEALDHVRQPGFLGKHHAVSNMSEYVPGALLWSKVVMICIVGRFVLHETERILHLSDIMVKGSCTYEKHIRFDAPGCSLGHVHDLERMLERTRCLLGKFDEQRVIGVGEFCKLRLRHKPEYPLEQEDQRIQRHREHGSDKQEEHLAEEIVLLHVVDQTEADVCQQQA